jgi:uncharacterized membrane protein (UPF0127 family)
MKRIVWIFIILFIPAAISGGAWFVIFRSRAGVLRQDFGPEVCLGNHCYKVEIARTQAEQERGLMYRTCLAPDAGMIFIFGQDGDQSFWMKNTLIPLDMVWIGSDYRVVFIKHGAQPCGSDVCPSIDPGVDARYVLEVNAGETNRVGAKIGDLVTIKNVP